MNTQSADYTYDELMTERGKLSLGRTQDQSTGGEGVSYKTFNTPVNKSVAAELDKLKKGSNSWTKSNIVDNGDGTYTPVLGANRSDLFSATRMTAYLLHLITFAQ